MKSVGRDLRELIPELMLSVVTVLSGNHDKS